MKYPGHWTLPKGHGDTALLTAKPLLKAVLQAGVCWNCGKEGHHLGEGKKPRDNKCIDANKTAFMKLKRDPKSKKMGNQESKEKGRRGKWILLVRGRAIGNRAMASPTRLTPKLNAGL
jgi:hypothetical protein